MTAHHLLPHLTISTLCVTLLVMTGCSKIPGNRPGSRCDNLGSPCNFSNSVCDLNSCRCVNGTYYEQDTVSCFIPSPRSLCETCSTGGCNESASGCYKVVPNIRISYNPPNIVIENREDPVVLRNKKLNRAPKLQPFDGDLKGWKFGGAVDYETRFKPGGNRRAASHIPPNQAIITMDATEFISKKLDGSYIKNAEGKCQLGVVFVDRRRVFVHFLKPPITRYWYLDIDCPQAS